LESLAAFIEEDKLTKVGATITRVFSKGSFLSAFFKSLKKSTNNGQKHIQIYTLHVYYMTFVK